MNCHVELVMFSYYDLAALSSVTRRILGRPICKEADKKNLSQESHNIECLKEFQTGTDVLDMYSVAFLLLIPEEETSPFLQLAGLHSLLTDTLNRDYKAVLVTGTVPQWVRAVGKGSSSNTSLGTREIYNRIKKAFDKIGLRGIFGKEKSLDDGTFLLEKK